MLAAADGQASGGVQQAVALAFGFAARELAGEQQPLRQAMRQLGADSCASSSVFVETGFEPTTARPHGGGAAGNRGETN